MNTAIATLKATLSALKMRKMDLDVQIGGYIKDAKTLLALASIRPIDQIDIEGACATLAAARDLKNERAKVMADIATIEQELA